MKYLFILVLCVALLGCGETIGEASDTPSENRFVLVVDEGAYRETRLRVFLDRETGREYLVAQDIDGIAITVMPREE